MGSGSESLAKGEKHHSQGIDPEIGKHKKQGKGNYIAGKAEYHAFPAAEGICNDAGGDLGEVGNNFSNRKEYPDKGKGNTHFTEKKQKIGIKKPEIL